MPEAILALARKAQRVAVGKRCGRHSTAQRFIDKRLVDAARRHRVVVRLKGSDSMLFGRAHEEIAHLRASGVAVQVVPGITAALAARRSAGPALVLIGAVFGEAIAIRGQSPNCADGSKAA